MRTAINSLTSALWQSPRILLPLPPLFWAINLLIGRAFAANLPPFGLTFWRWAVASVILVPIVWATLKQHREALRSCWKLILVCTVSGFICYPVLNYFGLHTTPAASASILNSTLPLMVPLFAWLISGDRPSARVVGGILISFVGVIWIVSQGHPSRVLEIGVSRGELLVLLAVAGYAFYSVCLRFRPKGLPDMAFLAAMSVGACVISMPPWIGEGLTGQHFPLATYSVLSVLFIGIFASLLGAAFWNRCIDLLGPSVTGASFHLMPVYASALALTFLGEPIHTFHLIGIALILIGFAIAVRLKPRPAAPSSN
ncbi:Permease of the drug/metabolite transporter (DMT) superfamily [Rhizobium sp. AN5]|uniref:DMT family transporter n=1 Tax=Rhizobium sp. AN5 TaxID=1855304 RepID=UPI000BDCB146|nr:DMT family transporter [Rhizobium sp. AN5]SOC90381.1 Permease of the drug/metabolite transporter (DMT) superfamily [Rhizobium sp. AN5]